jgi:hypothetical protein
MENVEFYQYVVGRYKTSINRQIAEALRIQMRGDTLNSTGVYNRCKLTRLIVDSHWDKNVWDDRWQAKDKEKAHLSSLADQDLLGEELMQVGEKRREVTGREGGNKKRRADNDAGESWRDQLRIWAASPSTSYQQAATH